MKANCYSTYYLHKDHLGSLATVLHNNTVVAKYSYDVWGRRRNYNDFTYTINPTQSNDYFGRFYTMHETLAPFGLINMNGRLYDPLLARMLSPDNYVQAPGSTQSFNRYSYCWNNPLKYTDPTGDFLTWSVNKNGFSIGVNFSPAGIPLGFGINVGWSGGGSVSAYGEVGYRVGGTGLGAGTAVSQSIGWDCGSGSWTTGTSANAYASFGPFTVGAGASANHNITYGGWSSDWSVSAGIGIGNGTAGIGLNVSYGSGGWGYGLGGYYKSSRKSIYADLADNADPNYYASLEGGPEVGLQNQNSTVEDLIQYVNSQDNGFIMTGDDIANRHSKLGLASSIVDNVEKVNGGIKVNLTFAGKIAVKATSHKIPNGTVFSIEKTTINKSTPVLKITAPNAKFFGNPFKVYVRGNSYSMYGQIFNPIFNK